MVEPGVAEDDLEGSVVVGDVEVGDDDEGVVVGDDDEDGGGDV